MGLDRLGSSERHWELAEGFALGWLEPVEGGWAVAPLLDYRSGLSQLSVIATPGEGLQSGAAPVALDDGRWRSARPLSSGDPSSWRETLAISCGTRSGVEIGAALVSKVRLLGRVARARSFDSTVSLLGDPGFTLIAVALIDGDPEPRSLGRLTSLGREGRAGPVRLAWQPSASPSTRAGSPAPGQQSAHLFTGAGEDGLPAGLYLGTAQLPLASVSAPVVLRLHDGPGGLSLEDLWVRLRGAGGSR